MTLNFQPQPTGHYLTHPVTAATGDAAPWLEIDPDGEITRRLGCVTDCATRFHDILVARDGDYWLMCDDTRAMDLTSVGGVASAQVTGTVIQHVSATGTPLSTGMRSITSTSPTSSSRAGQGRW